MPQIGRHSLGRLSTWCIYVIQRRISRIKPDPDALLNVLRSGAHIGCSFSIDEIKCLAGLSGQSLSHSIERAEALRFIQRDGDILRFTHEVIRAYFQSHSGKSAAIYSAKYSECLRVLRPSDYYTRCISLLNADKRDAASTAYCQGLTADWRAGDRAASPNVSADGLDVQNSEYLTTVSDAIRLLAEGDYRSAHNALASLHDGIPRNLRAVRDYLIAESLLKDLSQTKSAEARSLLLLWANPQR